MCLPIAAMNGFSLVALVVVCCLLMSAITRPKRRGGLFRKLVLCGLVVLGVCWIIASNDGPRGRRVIIHERGQRAAERDPWDSDFDYLADEFGDRIGDRAERFAGRADELGDRIGDRAERLAERVESRFNSRIKREIRRGSRGRSFPLTSEAEATIEIRLRPDRLRAKDVEEDDLAIALLDVVDQLLRSVPERKAELGELQQIVVIDDDETPVRLGEVVRLSRQRDFGGGDWRDSRVKISFASSPRRIFDLEDLFDEIKNESDSESMRRGWIAALTDEAIYFRLGPTFELPEAGIPDRALAEKSGEAESSEPAAAEPAETASVDEQPSEAETAGAKASTETTGEKAAKVVAETTASPSEADQPVTEAPAEAPATLSEVVESAVRAAGKAVAEAKLVVQKHDQDAKTKEQEKEQQEVAVVEQIESLDTAETVSRSRSGTRGRRERQQREEEPARIWPNLVTQKPAWLEEDSGWRFENGMTYVVRNTGAHDTKADCVHELELLLYMTTREYAAAEFGSKAGGIDIPIRRLQTIVQEECWIEEVSLDDFAVTYYVFHARFGFDDAVRREVFAAWQAEQVTDRLLYAGLAAAIVLGLVGSVFGYLKLDTATRGYYSGRLKLATGVVVVALLTVAAANFID